jgi:hypothetical protein
MHRSSPRLALLALLALGVVSACSLLSPPAPTTAVIPAPTCGGAQVVIPDALSCEELAEIAIGHLRREVPAQLERGVVSVTVELQGCPRNEVPPQLDCTGEDFVQLVTVTFGPTIEGGPIEPSLSVGISPVTGRILGIVNPLIL